jgi:hypothetical protein
MLVEHTDPQAFLRCKSMRLLASAGWLESCLVDSFAPLFYDCSLHVAMSGTSHIVD